MTTHLSVESKPVLERIRYTTQTAFDRAERMENLRGDFVYEETQTCENHACF